MKKYLKSLTSLLNADPTFVGAMGTTLLRDLAAPDSKSTQLSSILVAEDNLTDQLIINSQLKKLGFEAKLVSNGQQAIDALSSFAFDLILMDCQLPKLNGYQTTTAIRRGEAGIWESKTPVIAITGTQENLKKCVVAGMDDCLLKPLDFFQLEKVIRKFLKSEISETSTQTDPPSKDEKHLGFSTLISRIDTQAHDKLRMLQVPGEPDVLTEVVHLFASTAPHYLATMKEALAAQDLSLLAQSAHTLKSPSASLGAGWVETIARSLEGVSGPNALEEAAKLMGHLEIELQLAIAELEALIAERQTPEVL